MNADLDLPQLLKCGDGTFVSDPEIWERKRRPELINIFATEVFGHAPSLARKLSGIITQEDSRALGGLASRNEITIDLLGIPGGPSINLQLWLPNGVKGPIPIFIGCNFFGNHAVHLDPNIPICQRWMRASDREGHVVSNRATELSRGSEASRWQVERLIRRGYGLATYYYGDIEPDHPDGWRAGIRGALADLEETTLEDDQWGAIAAWAWGLSRCIDYLELDTRIDAKRIALVGHSRLGKAALWAGAIDQRFAVVIANNAGAGGASLARHRFGESIADLNRVFPHWFARNFKKYDSQEDHLPIDMHQLLALIAPRSLYVASASEDLWADPEGELLATEYSKPIFGLYGTTVGYHLRNGGHDITAEDWDQFLDFTDSAFA